MRNSYKNFIVLCERDIRKHFEISYNSVLVLRQIFFYQQGNLKKCIASKPTLCKHAQISKRSLYYCLKELQLKNLIHRQRRSIIVSNTFLRYLKYLYELYERCLTWAEFHKIKLQWFWKRCGQSMEKLFCYLRGNSETCTYQLKKLHPNSRLNSSHEFNMNSRSRLRLRLLIQQELERLSAHELKQLYLDKLNNTRSLQKISINSLSVLR